MICHGSSEARTITNAVAKAREYALKGVNDAISAALLNHDKKQLKQGRGGPSWKPVPANRLKAAPRDRPSPAYEGGVAILGTGVSLPPRVLTNEELAARVDTNDAWITQRTGIKTRRIVDDGQTVRDLARDALGAALVNANLEPGRWTWCCWPP